MERALCDRLAACLDRPEILAIDPERVAALRAALDEDDPPASAGRGGAVTGYDPGPGRRRLVTIDRRGHLTAACRWRADGTLAWAKCLTGDGDWIGIEPAADDHPAWGLSDRLWLLDSAGRVGAARGAHALSGRRLRAARRDPAALRAGSAAARRGHRRPQPDRRADEGPGRGAGALPRPLSHRAALHGAARVLPPRPGTGRPAPPLHGRGRRRLGARAPRAAPRGARRLRPAPPSDRQGRARRRRLLSARLAGRDPITSPAWCARRARASSARSGRSAARSRIGSRSIDRARCRSGPPRPSIRFRRRRCRPCGPRPSPSSSPARAPPRWRRSLRDVMRALTLEWGAVPGDLLEVDGARVRVSRRLRAAGVEWVGESAARPGASAARDRLRASRSPASSHRPRACAPRPGSRRRARPSRRARSTTPPHEGALPESVGRLLALVASGRA